MTPEERREVITTAAANLSVAVRVLPRSAANALTDLLGVVLELVNDCARHDETLARLTDTDELYAILYGTKR